MNSLRSIRKASLTVPQSIEIEQAKLLLETVQNRWKSKSPFPFTNSGIFADIEARSDRVSLFHLLALVRSQPPYR